MSNRNDGRPPYATFSLVFGLLCMPCFAFPLPAPLAVIFGHIALGHFGSRRADDIGRGRAWMGLFLGYLSLVVFGVVGGLAAIGFWFPPEEATPAPAATASTSEAPAPQLPPPAEGRAQDTDVYVVEGDPRYHRFFCRTTAGANTRRVTLLSAAEAGFRSCEVCQPTPP